MRNNLIYEIIVIGVITMIFNSIIYTLLTGKLIINSQNYQTMLFGSFLLGASMHLSFELIGFNESWCRKEFP